MSDPTKQTITEIEDQEFEAPEEEPGTDGFAEWQSEQWKEDRARGRE